MSLEVDAVEGLEPGRKVVVAIDRSVSLAGVFFLFGLPLMGLVAGAAVGHFHPFFGMSGEASAVVLGLTLLVAAFLIALVYDRKVAARRTPRPRIVRIDPE